MTKGSQLPRTGFDAVAGDFVRYLEQASQAPLAVERGGDTGLVLMPLAEWERLARLDTTAQESAAD